MDYLKEIKAFYNLAELNLLSTGQIALWHALIYINNTCFWQQWFTVPNSKLQLLTGLSRQAILKNRNKLKQIGVLDFRENGTRATRYMLKSCQASCLDGCRDGCQSSCQDGCTLIKQDNTTQDKTENNISSPTPPSNNPKNNEPKEDKEESAEPRRVLGKYKHVRLTDKQIEKLKAEWGEETFLAYVKRADEYCQQKGKTYADYNLTIRNWKRRDDEEAEKKRGQTTGVSPKAVPKYGHHI